MSNSDIVWPEDIPRLFSTKLIVMHCEWFCDSRITGKLESTDLGMQEDTLFHQSLN